RRGSGLLRCRADTLALQLAAVESIAMKSIAGAARPRPRAPRASGATTPQRAGRPRHQRPDARCPRSLTIATRGPAPAPRVAPGCPTDGFARRKEHRRLGPVRAEKGLRSAGNLPTVRAHSESLKK